MTPSRQAATRRGGHRLPGPGKRLGPSPQGEAGASAATGAVVH